MSYSRINRQPIPLHKNRRRNNNVFNNSDEGHVMTLHDRTDPKTAETIFIILEVITLIVVLASCIAFGMAIWVASMDIEAHDADWFFKSELYWNAAIFGLTLAAILLVYSASEKHLAQRDQLLSSSSS